MDTVALSRMQFALTAIFHMLWPVLTTGMAIYLVIVEGLWLKTKNPIYYHHARFWAKLYVLNFGIGVASGLPMEFQFGTNWAPLSEATGDFLGSILGFEGAMAFMLEAGFLGIMLFGWNRVPPVIHYFATIMVAFGANLSTFWILVANSWLQTPAGGTFTEGGKFIVRDYFEAIFNPFMVTSVAHMFMATLETSLFVIGGISAWYLIQNRQPEFFSRSFKIVLATAIAVAPLQIYIGHLSGEQVRHMQPTKLAAMEAQWESIPAGTAADWSLVALPNDKAERNDWELKIPKALGYILEFKPTLSEAVPGLRDFPPENRPHMVGLIYYAFRTMVGIGFFLAGLMGITVLQWLRGKLKAGAIAQQRILLAGWIFAAPLGYLAVESGWIVRCVGRQPWTVYGQIRTVDAATNLPPGDVITSLSIFALIYTVLFVTALYFGSRIIRHGPNLDLPIPSFDAPSPPLASVTHQPDQRPVEAQQ